MDSKALSIDEALALAEPFQTRPKLNRVWLRPVTPPCGLLRPERGPQLDFASKSGLSQLPYPVKDQLRRTNDTSRIASKASRDNHTQAQEAGGFEFQPANGDGPV